MILQNILLLGMLISYSIPIIYVYSQFKTDTTLSDIICDDKCKNIIFTFMIIMGIFTFLYELYRNDTESIIYISIILITIYGLLLNGVESIYHFIFAIFCLFAIFCFMVHHTYVTSSIILFFFTFLNYWVILSMILFIQSDIIIYECLFLVFFALFYIYLHYLSYFL
jgi:hypothetical protein